MVTKGAYLQGALGGTGWRRGIQRRRRKVGRKKEDQTAQIREDFHGHLLISNGLLPFGVFIFGSFGPFETLLILVTKKLKN